MWMRPRAIFRKALGRAERWRSRPAESTDGVLSYEITRYGPDLREQVLELQKHLGARICPRTPPI
jgi:hypothetical protein